MQGLLAQSRSNAAFSERDTGAYGRGARAGPFPPQWDRESRSARAKIHSVANRQDKTQTVCNSRVAAGGTRRRTRVQRTSSLAAGWYANCKRSPRELYRDHFSIPREACYEYSNLVRLVCVRIAVECRSVAEHRTRQGARQVWRHLPLGVVILRVQASSGLRDLVLDHVRRTNLRAKDVQYVQRELYGDGHDDLRADAQ